MEVNKMQLFYYMTSSSKGIQTVYARSFWGAWAAVKSWFMPNTTFIIWDKNDNIRIIHGGANNE
jgi:hypothetical protein